MIRVGQIALGVEVALWRALQLFGHPERGAPLGRMVILATGSACSDRAATRA